MKLKTYLDDGGHVLILVAVALLGFALMGATLLGTPDMDAHRQVSSVYTDELAAGVLVYRLPVMDVIASRAALDAAVRDTPAAQPHPAG